MKLPGGRVARLALAAFALLGFQYLAVLADVAGASEGGRRAAIAASSAGAAMVAIVLVQTLRMATVVALGSACNLIAIVLHGGAMPIDVERAVAAGALSSSQMEDQLGRLLDNSKDVPLRSGEIRTPWLADRFDLEIPGLGRNVYSAGDFILAVGLLLSIAEIAARFGRSGEPPVEPLCPPGAVEM